MLRAPQREDRGANLTKSRARNSVGIHLDQHGPSNRGARVGASHYSGE